MTVDEGVVEAAKVDEAVSVGVNGSSSRLGRGHQGEDGLGRRRRIRRRKRKTPWIGVKDIQSQLSDQTGKGGVGKFVDESIAEQEREEGGDEGEQHRRKGERGKEKERKEKEEGKRDQGEERKRK